MATQEAIGKRSPALPEVEEFETDRHRRRPGGALGRLLPASAGPAVRDPRRERADRRLLADANLGLAAPVHAGPLRRAAGLAVPGAAAGRFRRRDEMADYLEAYAARFDLPVRTGVAVDAPGEDGRPVRRPVGRAAVRGRPRRRRDGPLRQALESRSSLPSSIPRIVQLHSSEYRNPAQLRPGGVLLVGAGNSGADIAMDVSRRPRHLAVGTGQGAGAGPRSSSRCARVVLPILWFVAIARADDEDAARTQGPPASPRRGRRRCIRVKSERSAAAGVSGAEDGGRPGRPAGARGRPRARRRERHLVHRVPPGLLLDRPAGLRRRPQPVHDARRRPRRRASTSSASTSSTRSPRRTSAA